MRVQVPSSKFQVPRFFRITLFWVIGVWMIIAGCAVGPNYKRPQTGVPPAFRDQLDSSTNSLGDLPWSNVFQDDSLQNLIRTALTNNYDLRIAVTRVEQAQAIAAEARSQFFPQVTYQGLAERGKNAANGFPTATRHTTNDFFAVANASWEIDLWGRIRRLNEAARAQFLASREAQRDVRISIISQTAQAYFQLLALDADLRIAEDATNAFSQTLKLFNDQLRYGVASRLETSAAQANEATAAAEIPELKRQIVVQEDEINVLLGKYLGPVRREDSSLEKLSIPDVPVGLPSALLERRPDIREAEQELRAANAQIGVVVASFFPQLSLTGMFGQVSPELSMFTGGAANAWSVAAGVTGPLFQGGQLTAQYRQAKAAREQFRLQYEQIVLNGFREVSDALLSHQYYAEERLANEQAVAAYKDAVDVAIQRFRLGQASYYEVLQEQQQLYPAEDALVATGLNQFLSMVQLYQALGGGWDSKDSKP
jgi:multidrug efflux system outer membrane protein